MDIDAVRPGAIVIAPVKVPGAGIYFGDMHAMQGDGEIAGHTMDVSGTVTLRVEPFEKDEAWRVRSYSPYLRTCRRSLDRWTRLKWRKARHLARPVGPREDRGVSANLDRWIGSESK